MLVARERDPDSRAPASGVGATPSNRGAINRYLGRLNYTTPSHGQNRDPWTWTNLWQHLWQTKLSLPTKRR